MNRIMNYQVCTVSCNKAREEDNSIHSKYETKHKKETGGKQYGQNRWHYEPVFITRKFVVNSMNIILQYRLPF